MPVFKVTVSKVDREVRFVTYKSSFHIEAASLEDAEKAAVLIDASEFNLDIDDVVGGEWEQGDDECDDSETRETSIDLVKGPVGNLIEPDVIAEEVIKYSEEHS